MAACCLDACNVPGLPGIPPTEHEKAWAIVEELCVKVIDEVRGAEDAHTHYHTGKTGVTADRDKIEFRLFNSSSIFNITLREELFSLPK